MGAIAFFAVLVGLDNLQASSALGMMPLRSARKWQFALAFGAFEAIMPLIGLLLGQHLHHSFESVAGIIGPLMLFVCGFLVFHTAWNVKTGSKQIHHLANSRWTLLGLPLSLSLDNLFAGIGLGAMGYPILFSALVVGLVSGAMALGGLFIGSGIRRLIRWNTSAVSGVYLMVMSAILLLVDFD